VTTIRVCGSQGLLPQEARQAMRHGAFRGPRLLTCGKIISATAPGGRFYGDMYREADGPDDMRRAVREQLRAGADFVKVMTTGARSNELEDPDPLQLTEAELAAVIDEAHRMGFRVCAHAEGLDGCEAAIRLGVDTIEHGMYLHRRPDLLAAMAANGQVLVPTLSGYYWMAGFGEVVDPADAEPNPDMPPVLADLAVRNLTEGAATMRAASAAGVPIAVGSDMSLATGLEILRMVQHGLSPAEVLVAATSTAAEALGLADHIGTIAEGNLADLLVVDADPLTDPTVLNTPTRISLVLQLGAPVAGPASANVPKVPMVRLNRPAEPERACRWHQRHVWSSGTRPCGANGTGVVTSVTCGGGTRSLGATSVPTWCPRSFTWRSARVARKR
jgi:imidazolonepropionase-like amidohydrolase